MENEKFELIELLGTDNECELEFCLIVSFEKKRKAFLLSYPVLSRTRKKYIYRDLINFN